MASIEERHRDAQFIVVVSPPKEPKAPQTTAQKIAEQAQGRQR